jgi:hypothetical protein
MTSRQQISQVLLILVGGLGTFAGLRLSVDHMKHGEVCPVLGPVPACIIVFLGYFLVVVATFEYRKSWAGKLFYFGWTPVFLLALSGVVLELTKGHICPPGAAGIPQCFFSLGMSILVWGLFRTLRKPAIA